MSAESRLVPQCLRSVRSVGRVPLGPHVSSLRSVRSVGRVRISPAVSAVSVQVSAESAGKPSTAVKARAEMWAASEASRLGWQASLARRVGKQVTSKAP